MKVENNKIVSATEFELYEVWTYYEWYEILSFHDYLLYMKNVGCEIKEIIDEANQSKC